MAVLCAPDKTDFGFVRDTVEPSDSARSQHVAVLEQAGEVIVTKVKIGRRSRTWLSAARLGVAWRSNAILTC